MKGAALFGLFALVPMVLPSAPAMAQTVTVSLCGGEDVPATVNLPIRRAPTNPAGDDDCHVKGCHAGNSRKRGDCHI